MKRRSLLATAGAAVMIAAPAVTGCSPSSGQGKGPFTLPCDPASCNGSFVQGPVLAGHIYDVEILNLHNYSGNTARLTSVQLIRPSSGIRVINARAYLISQVRGGGSAIDDGDLAKDCPKFYKPHPVTDVVVAGHADSRWVVVIELIFERPGRYRFGTARINYVTEGQPGWQYFGLPDVRVHTVPMKTNQTLYRPLRCHPGQSGP